MELKKIYIIIVVLVILLVGVLGASIYFGRKTSDQLPTDTAEQIPPEQEEENLTPGKTAVLKSISPEPALAPAIDQGKIKYYSAINGNVYQSNFDGSNLNKLSDIVLSGLLKVIWSPDKTRVISVFEENNQAKKYLYDYSSKESKPLNENIRDIVWSPDANKIAYQYYDQANEENNISIANPDGSNWKNILKIRIKDLIIEWPSQDKISIRTKPSGLAQSVLYLVNSQTGGLTKILDEINGLSINWSPEGDKFIYSSTNEQGNRLKLSFFDLTTQKTKTLGLSTFPEKCAWSQDNRTIFCAVPQSDSGYEELPCPADKTLPDDWYKGTFETTDDFYKINLETNEKNLLLSASFNGPDAKNLLLSGQERYLLFINKKDGLLYSLEIK